MPIKVLVVDDSALMRALLSEIINGAPDLEVVGTAPDPIAAREMIKALNPDVLTLDVEMPRMDGLEFLRHLMRLRPMPVIMISALTERGSEVTLQALEIGAVDFLAKPRAENVSQLLGYADEIRDKIRMAKSARLKTGAVKSVEGRGAASVVAAAAPISAAASAALSLGGGASRNLKDRVVAIGASTGGTEAIKDVLSRLPAEMPPIVMVQHMPETFTPSFARRLDTVGPLRVVEAQGGERLQSGTAYLAPGHSHMSVRRSAGGYVLELAKSEPVNRHRPAVDVLFHSVAEQVRNHALGVILTGMGKDGAQGMLAMRKAGAWNIGQDQASCVVYGMPKEAAQVGAVDEVAALPDIAARIVARLRAEPRA
ncbi:MAG TPA: chemotaxis response regulator protein-glutamate methylesterase [Rhodocyclaceae bacterium]|nr:chemotaxis response regulator protein-glutamate methylesterase [Rhodocyclaceae bacterium]